MTLNGAIMQLVEMRENSMMPFIFKPYFDKVIETVSECVEPSEIPQWIPCSERLPDDVEFGENYPIVLFSTKDKIYIGFYVYEYDCNHEFGGQWWKYDEDIGNDEVDDVLAWMPLREFRIAFPHPT